MLCLSDEPRPHHDGLEDLPLDGPQLAVGRRLDGRRPLAVVEDGQLAEDLPGGQDREELALARHLHLAICKRSAEERVRVRDAAESGHDSSLTELNRLTLIDRRRDRSFDPIIIREIRIPRMGILRGIRDTKESFRRMKGFFPCTVRT